MAVMYFFFFFFLLNFFQKYPYFAPPSVYDLETSMLGKDSGNVGFISYTCKTKINKKKKKKYSPGDCISIYINTLVGSAPDDLLTLVLLNKLRSHTHL